jgi:hypothetical protein
LAAHTEQHNLVFEEIKEGDEEEDDNDEVKGQFRGYMLTSNNEEINHKNAESPMDASGGANENVRQYLVTMSGDNLSPSPKASSPIMYQSGEKPNLSMLDMVKRDEKFNKNN